MDLGGGLQSGFGLISAMLSVIALGVYALLSEQPNNDDDDSSPGGGIMQPVA